MSVEKGNSNHNTRSVQLDLLRGIAILMVLVTHCGVDPSHSGKLERIARNFTGFGWSGVDLFFVLSGFLVGGLLFKEIRARHSLDVKRFLLRRGFKIWPAYIALVV